MGLALPLAISTAHHAARSAIYTVLMPLMLRNASVPIVVIDDGIEIDVTTLLFMKAFSATEVTA